MRILRWTLCLRFYDVQFDDGTIEEDGANLIAQSVLEQVEDSECHYAEKIAVIVDHCRER